MKGEAVSPGSLLNSYRGLEVPRQNLTTLRLLCPFQILDPQYNGGGFTPLSLG